MSVSARLDLPLLAPGQAQKEFFHNEALQALELIVQPVISEMSVSNPPVDPVLGELFVIGPEPTSEFAGRAHAIACWTEGGWRFRDPFEGLEIAMQSTGVRARFTSGEWQTGVVNVASVLVDGQRVLSGRQPPIADVTGGSVVDQQARSTLAAVLMALRSHGLIAEG